MAFTDVFGGELIFPSQLSYLRITTAVDIQLQWPTEQQITGGNVVADFMDIDATAASINISMPDARNTSTGNKTSISNEGANDFDVLDATGGPIQTIQQGDVWVLVLTDNSTEAGTWSTFQLGATVSVASAAALAGAGIKAIGMTLNQKIDSDIEALSPITVVEGDRAKCLIWTGGAGQADLPDPGAVGDDWFFMIRNSGTGTLTIIPPSGTIDGSSEITIEPNGSTFIFTDDTDFFTVGLTTSSTIGFDFVSLPVPGSGDFVLSGANVDRISYRFTGALTGNRRIVVPNTTQQYWCENQTSGAFQLTISTPAQVSPPELEQGQTAIFSCDAVNVINAVNATSISLPLSVVQGGTGANNPIDARNNLEAAHDELELFAGNGLVGGGTLQADRTFEVAPGIGVGVNPDDVFLDYTTVTTAVPDAADFITFQDVDDSDITKKALLSDVVDATPQQLFDSANNVRVSAELLGVAEIRSDGNVDAEIRAIVGAYADQTVRWGVGQPTASPNLIIENLMSGGSIQLRSGPSSSVSMFVGGGTLRATASLIASQFDIFADGNSDTEQQLLQLKDSSGNVKAELGWTNTEAKLHLANNINGQELELRGFDFGGNPRTYLLADPDIDVKLFHDGTETFRTAAAASGGAEANNLDTGAGFERVLTTADLGGGGAAYRGCKAFKTGATAWPRDDSPNSTFTGPTAAAAAVAYNAEVLDTDSIHTTGGSNTRFTVPAGVSKARMRGNFRMAGLFGGGVGKKHVLIRRNGSTTITIDPGQTSWIPLWSTDEAAGTGSNWGYVGFDSGIIEVTPTDFFEVFILTQAGNAVSLANQAWCEFEIVE